MIFDGFRCRADRLLPLEQTGGGGRREEGVLLSPRSHKWRRVLELSLIAVFCAAYLGTLLAANRYGMAVYTGLLLWILYAALLSLVIHGSRYLMKKHGFPAEHNLLLSTFITIIAALVLTAGLFWVSLRLVGTPLGHPNAEKRPSPAIMTAAATPTPCIMIPCP